PRPGPPVTGPRSPSSPPSSGNTSTRRPAACWRHWHRSRRSVTCGELHDFGMDAVTSRRAFLRGTAGAGAGLAVTGALSGAATGGSANGGSANGGEAGGGTVAFHGARQAGIVTPAQPQATVLACDVLAADSAGL